MSVDYKQILPFESSFQLVRTNPKLTGNIKLTVDSDQNMWLNSIDANSDLAKDQYKHYALDSTVSHEAQIKDFFNGGKTQSSIVFDLTEQVNVNNSSTKYEDQFDFSNYFSGARYLDSKYYSEKFSYLAPIYLGTQLPEYFIIFKISGATNHPIGQSQADYPFDIQQYAFDMFNNSQVVALYDMTSRSKLGSYLTKIINNPILPLSPLAINFQQDQLSYFRGISIPTGAYASIGENLYQFYRDAQPITGFEEYITLGFERNSIIHPFLFNLEFLFDDSTANIYDINRYVGFYCNLVELQQLNIDLDRYLDRSVNTNTPGFRRTYDLTDDVSIFQTNTNGVDIFTQGTEIDGLDQYSADKLYFPYLLDRNNDLYIIKQNSIKIDTLGDRSQFKTTATSLDLGKLFGPADLFVQDTGVSVKLQGHSYYEIKFSSNLQHLDRIRLYHIGGSREDQNGLFDDVTATIGWSEIPNSGDLYSYYDTQNSLGDLYYFNPLGTVVKMVDTLARSFNSIKTKGFTAFAYNDRLFIKANDSGFYDSKFSISLSFLDSTYPSITVFDTITGKTNLHTIQTFFRGGSSGYQLLLDIDHYDKIFANQSSLLVKTDKGWSHITNVSKYASIINETNSIDPILRAEALAQFDKYMSVHLESGQTADVQYTIGTIRTMFTARTGVLSFLDIRDFDFDRLASDYVKIPNIDLYKEYYVPPNRTILMTNDHKYLVIGTGQVKIGDQTYFSGDSISDIGNNLQYTVTQGDCILIEDSVRVQGLTGSYYNTIDLSGPIILSRVDETIDFNWGEGTPGPNIGNDNFSIRWVGQIVTDFSETYTFYTQSDDGIRIWVNEVEIINNWTDHGSTENSGTISLTANTKYDIVIEYYEHTSIALISLSWSSPSTPKQIVPSVNLFTNSANSLLTSGLYDQNQEQLNFNGFASIKSADATILDNSSLLFKYRDKYTNGILSTEYDFANENFTKNYALKSKIIPYITKWGFLNGRDVRDNYYRLNTDIAFGINNFAPDHFSRLADTNNFTHEWFYIESNFNYVDDVTSLLENKYYFDLPLNISETDKNNSILFNELGFDEYFIYTPTKDSVEIGQSQFRYSLLKKNEQSVYQTFFKGINFTFREVSPLNTIDSNGKPTFVSNTSRFDGYKFSTIVKIKKEDFSGSDPISYKFIEHRQFKWIVFIIEIKMSSIDQIDEDQLQLDSSSDQPTEPGFDDIFGDYRISFDTNLVSNLDYSFFYYAINKKYNNLLDSFSTVSLGNKLDFSNLGITNLSNGFSINRINRDYFIDLNDEISLQTRSTQDVVDNYYLYLKGTAGDYILKKSVTDNFPIITDIQLNKIFVDSVTNLVLDGQNSSTGIEYQIPSSSTNYWNLFNFYQFKGGRFNYQNLFRYMSFAYVKDLINKFKPNIQYITYDLFDQNVIATSGQFYLEVNDPEFIQKDQVISTDPDILDLAISANTVTDISTNSTSFPKQVGFVMSVNDLTSPYTLTRYSGDYDIIFKTITCFRSNASLMNDSISLSFANNIFNTKFLDNFKIKNFNHIKVSDKTILTLANDPKFQSVYPLIGEVAIGQNDYFLLGSNWEFGFHFKYSDKVTYSPVAGTLRIGEDSCFVSKLLNMPLSIDLSNFLNSIADINSLNGNYSNYEIVYQEDLQTVNGIINLTNVFTRYLSGTVLADNLKSTFLDINGNPIISSTDYLGNITIDQYITAYAQQNLVSLYTIDTIEVWTKPIKSLTSTLIGTNGANPNTIQFINLIDLQRAQQGYTLNKNVGINKLDNFLLKFNIQKPVDSSLLVSLNIKIKLI